MYDTYKGKPAPTAADITYVDTKASERWQASQREGSNEWVSRPLKNMLSTGYSSEKVLFTEGRKPVAHSGVSVSG